MKNVELLIDTTAEAEMRNVNLSRAIMEATDSSERDLINFNSIADALPELPDNAEESLMIIRNFLLENGYSYNENTISFHDVLESRSGNCLSLTLLVCALLESRGKKPECKILIHPMDAVHRSDVQLFNELNSGEYFSYDSPKLPELEKQPSPELRFNRFTPLGHPIVMLDGVPFETTLIFDEEANPIIEFPSELSTNSSTIELVSFLYSDKAKGLVMAIGNSDEESRKVNLDLFKSLIDKSLSILPNNRDAINLLYAYYKETGDKALAEDVLLKYKSLGLDDSEYLYKLWGMTNDKECLDRAYEKFPENILAFIDKKVMLEPDKREARFNLAVALWCVFYSGSLSLEMFLRDPQIVTKIHDLFHY